jgi:hypothetical protein
LNRISEGFSDKNLDFEQIPLKTPDFALRTGVKNIFGETSYCYLPAALLYPDKKCPPPM